MGSASVHVFRVIVFRRFTRLFGLFLEWASKNSYKKIVPMLEETLQQAKLCAFYEYNLIPLIPWVSCVTVDSSSLSLPLRHAYISKDVISPSESTGSPSLGRQLFSCFLLLSNQHVLGVQDVWLSSAPLRSIVKQAGMVFTDSGNEKNVNSGHFKWLQHLPEILFLYSEAFDT